MLGIVQRYRDETIPALRDRFAYDNVMQVPRLEKIVVNMGVGDTLGDSKALDAAARDLATITGQRPIVMKAKKSVAAFSIRQGMPVGLKVTLRGERMHAFLERLINSALPRIRDFRGLSPRGFDGRGNYSMGLREQLIFPEIDYDSVDKVRGMDVCIVTTAATDEEGFALLRSLGMPFQREG